MGNMINRLDFSASSRPAYTKYEIAKMVKEKRSAMCMSREEFSEKFGLKQDTLEAIEDASRSFNVVLMKACSAILEMPIEELTRKNSEDINNYSFRSGEINDSIKEIVSLVDGIFNEIVMQRKLSVR